MPNRKYRQTLLRQRRALLARYHDELARVDEELDTKEIEDIDRATEQWDAQVLSSLGDADAHALSEIVAALRRIDDGTFGTCIECANRIGAARLEALPAAATCIDCATESERSTAAASAR